MAVRKTGEGILTDDNELRKELARSRGQSNGLGVTLRDFVTALLRDLG